MCGFDAARALEESGRIRILKGSHNGALFGYGSAGLPYGFNRARSSYAGAVEGDVVFPLNSGFPGEAQYPRWAVVIDHSLIVEGSAMDVSNEDFDRRRIPSTKIVEVLA